MKKDNKIKIKGRLRSLFTLHSDGKNAGGNLNLRERKNSSKKKGRRGRAPERGLFPLLFSSSAGLPFPLTGLQSPLDNPLSLLKLLFRSI